MEILLTIGLSLVAGIGAWLCLGGKEENEVINKFEKVSNNAIRRELDAE